jgi:methylated-DNA-[protein]-cysteine S-methyltransferase
MTTIETTYASPVGPLGLLAEDGSLTRLRFGARGRDDGALPAVREQLDAYFAGELRAFDVPVVLRGSAFERAVWAVLRTIGYGETLSYGEVTRRLGRGPADARAVGAAIGRTPVPIIVPCHRVIGADGSLTGYGGGLPRKRFLLDLEQRVSGQTLM